MNVEQIPEGRGEEGKEFSSKCKVIAVSPFILICEHISFFCNGWRDLVLALILALDLYWGDRLVRGLATTIGSSSSKLYSSIKMRKNKQKKGWRKTILSDEMWDNNLILTHDYLK